MPEDILGEAKVRISYDDLNKLDRQVDMTGRKFVHQFDAMETKTMRLSRSLSGIGGIIATIGIAKFTSDVMHASTTMDTLNRMLLNVEGSQEAANKRFEEFRKLAKEPVLDPFNLSKYYVALKSVRIESEISIPFMKSLANAMAGVGAGNEQFARSMEQFVQMMGKGKLVGQDLRVIAESFPQIRKYLAEAFEGLTDPEEIAKRGYTARDVMIKLNEQMEKAPKFAGGAQASFDNFKQSLMLFEGTLGKTVLPTVTKFLDKMTELMDKFGELPESIQKVIGWGTLGAAGGAGLLGIAAVLSNIINLSKLATTGLAGLGGVAAGAGIAAGATTPLLSGLKYGMGAGVPLATGAGAGAVATGLATKIPTLAIGAIAATTAFIAGMKIGDLIFPKKRYTKEGEFIPEKGIEPFTEEEQKRFAAWTAGYLAKLKPEKLPLEIQELKIPPYESYQQLMLPLKEQIENRQKAYEEYLKAYEEDQKLIDKFGLGKGEFGQPRGLESLYGGLKERITKMPEFKVGIPPEDIESIKQFRHALFPLEGQFDAVNQRFNELADIADKFGLDKAILETQRATEISKIFTDATEDQLNAVSSLIKPFADAEKGSREYALAVQKSIETEKSIALTANKAEEAELAYNQALKYQRDALKSTGVESAIYIELQKELNDIFNIGYMSTAEFTKGTELLSKATEDGIVTTEEYTNVLVYLKEQMGKVKDSQDDLSDSISKYASQIERDMKDIRVQPKKPEFADESLKDAFDTEKIWKTTAMHLESTFDRAWDKIWYGSQQTWRQMFEQLLVDWSGTMVKMAGKDIGKSLLAGTKLGTSLGITTTGSLFGELSFAPVVTALAPLVPILGVLGGFYWAWKDARREDKADKLSAMASYTAYATGKEFPTMAGRRARGYELYGDLSYTAVERAEGQRGRIGGRREIPEFQHGGINMEFTLAKLHPKEAVIPLESPRGKQMLSGMSSTTIENINVSLVLPNATLDSVDQNQVDRLARKLVPSIRRELADGVL